MMKIDFENIELKSGVSAVAGKITGAIDTQSVGQLEKALEEKFQEGYKYQLLDFGRVKHTSSAGIGSLIKLVDMAGEQGGVFVL